MIAIDTNVLVRHLVRDDADQAERADAFLRSLTAERPGFITTVVWAEVYWALTQPYRLNRRQVAESLRDMLQSVEIHSEHPSLVAEALAAAITKGADFADALIGAAARRARCTEVVTFDKQAAKILNWREL
ncbi:MAG: type II toxin-antitoxin system VapC family toxin [Promicromonosporaceae bacterium]|nr:type II toxin-antitoxin system VapC family toxin [Promicromonosporaceae bacterium]